MSGKRFNIEAIWLGRELEHIRRCIEILWNVFSTAQSPRPTGSWTAISLSYGCPEVDGASPPAHIRTQYIFHEIRGFGRIDG